MNSNTLNDEVFLGQIEMDRNPEAYRRLTTVQNHMRYDMNLYGMWIKRGSTAHNLAIILGFQLQDDLKSVEEKQHSNQYKWNLNQLKNP